MCVLHIHYLYPLSVHCSVCRSETVPAPKLPASTAQAFSAGVQCDWQHTLSKPHLSVEVCERNPRGADRQRPRYLSDRRRRAFPDNHRGRPRVSGVQILYILLLIFFLCLDKWSCSPVSPEL